MKNQNLEDKQRSVLDSKQVIVELGSEIILLQEELDRLQEIKSLEGQREVLLQEINKIK